MKINKKNHAISFEDIKNKEGPNPNFYAILIVSSLLHFFVQQRLSIPIFSQILIGIF